MSQHLSDIKSRSKGAQTFIYSFFASTSPLEMPVPVPIDRFPGSFDYYESYEPASQSLKAKVRQTSATSMKSLPAQWMRDESIFELEKRAIFSKGSPPLHSSHILPFV